MLNIENVHTYYGNSHVLHGVTLQVAQGSVAALLGRNGVGKTTLCRSIVGFTPAREGSILFNNLEITHTPAHKIARLRMSLVPQGRRIFPSLTVKENLQIAVQQFEVARVNRNHHTGVLIALRFMDRDCIG